MGTTEIKAELSGSKAITLKIRRIANIMEINITNEFITVHYTEVSYYIEDGEEVITSTENKSYKADFITWRDSDLGASIITALETELEKATPGE